jgi:pyridoxal phosphate enzyme (YggS family)
VVSARLAEVRARIRAAGRDPADVQVVAITKGRSLDDCRAALDAGLGDLGENRVQEALPKLERLPEATWHLVGHLQTNKVRHAAGRFALIQSVDSLETAQAIAKRVREQRVLVEVNVAREPQKHGVAPEQALDLVARVAGLLDLRGLMGMGPASGDPAPAFWELRRLHDAAEQRLGQGLPVLSMGMSDDFEAALGAGSSMLRLGRALFSPQPISRTPKTP